MGPLKQLSDDLIILIYQLPFQGVNAVLIAGSLVRQLLLGHLLGHLNALHHLLLGLQVGLLYLRLQPEGHTHGDRRSKQGCSFGLGGKFRALRLADLNNELG